MFSRRSRLSMLLVPGALVFVAASAQAQVTNDYVVDSHAMPWLTAANPSALFGIGDGLAPLILTSGDGYSFAAGTTFTITYLSGLTTPYATHPPYVDAIGDTTYDASDNPGTSGTFFPSRYSDSSQYPIYLNALMGTFTDSAGTIVGTPFATGNGPFNVAVPVGATQLQLGINDDVYSDNSGALNIRVSAAPVSDVPEPGTIALLVAAGTGGAALLRRKRKGTYNA